MKSASVVGGANPPGFPPKVSVKVITVALGYMALGEGQNLMAGDPKLVPGGWCRTKSVCV